MSDKLKDDVKLSKKQNEAYSIMASGKNIFLTGAAGVGKTQVLKLFIKVYKQTKIMGVTSTTGISALLFGGTTLHSFLGIGLGNGSVENICTKIFSRSYLNKRWKDLEVLVIDEISMLSPALFDKLEEVARTVRRNVKPFGGIQLILSGDFCQLPCINSDNFCFEADSWDKCIDHTIYLTEIMRQKDIEFQECLNEVRIGKLSKTTKKLLKSRLNIKLTNEFGILPTRLYSTNRSVDSLNDTELDKLSETNVEFFEYNMDIKYAKKNEIAVDMYKKFCSAPETIQLCVGAQVMLLWNLDIEGGLVNGSRGIIINFVNNLPLVKFLNGREVVIDYHTWEHEENEKKILTVFQIPLKLAYALTIHRSQGCSLDYAEIDLSDCFSAGQSYVALSRVKNLEGLSIIGIDFDKIITHPKAVCFYDSYI
jgi:ATP-dependent DNA helicase PIF1